MGTEAFLKAYSAGLDDLIDRRAGGYLIQKERLANEEITSGDGLLPMFAFMAVAELRRDDPSVEQLYFKPDQSALLDCVIGSVPHRTSLSRMLLGTSRVLNKLAETAPKGKPIVLDELHKEWLVEWSKIKAKP